MHFSRSPSVLSSLPISPSLSPYLTPRGGQLLLCHCYYGMYRDVIQKHFSQLEVWLRCRNRMLGCHCTAHQDITDDYWGNVNPETDKWQQKPQSHNECNTGQHT